MIANYEKFDGATAFISHKKSKRLGIKERRNLSGDTIMQMLFAEISYVANSSKKIISQVSPNFF